MFGTLSGLVGVSENTSVSNEISMFNKGFEAYNKKLMYGTDIVSVLNKAIDNNKSYGIEFFYEPGNPEMKDYYVNVIFEYYKRTQDATKTNELVKYSLKENYTKNPNTNIIKAQFINPILANDNNDIIHSFKVAGFKCTGINYLQKADTKIVSALGRVKEITFREIN